MKTIDISPVNHGYWSYSHQLSYLGGTTLYGFPKMGDPQVTRGFNTKMG